MILFTFRKIKHLVKRNRTDHSYERTTVPPPPPAGVAPPIPRPPPGMGVVLRTPQLRCARGATRSRTSTSSRTSSAASTRGSSGRSRSSCCTLSVRGGCRGHSRSGSRRSAHFPVLRAAARPQNTARGNALDMPLQALIDPRLERAACIAADAADRQAAGACCGERRGNRHPSGGVSSRPKAANSSVLQARAADGGNALGRSLRPTRLRANLSRRSLSWWRYSQEGNTQRMT